MVVLPAVGGGPGLRRLRTPAHRQVAAVVTGGQQFLECGVEVGDS